MGGSSSRSQALDFLKVFAKSLTDKGWSLEDAFRSYDSDGNKVLDQKEFVAMVKDVCPTASDSTALRLFAEADLDGDGSVDFNEFSQEFGSHLFTHGAKLMHASKYRRSSKELRPLRRKSSKELSALDDGLQASTNSWLDTTWLVTLCPSSRETKLDITSAESLPSTKPMIIFADENASAGVRLESAEKLPRLV